MALPRAGRLFLLAVLAASAASPLAARTLAEFDWGKAPAGVGFVSEREGVSDPMALGPQAFVVGPDGRLALADTWNSRVLLLDRSAGVIGSVRVAGHPRALALSASGELAVATAGGPVLARFDRSGQLQWTLAADDDAASRIGQIDALAFHPSGSLLAGDIASGRIWVLSASGELAGELPWDGGGLVVTQDGSVLDLAFAPGEGAWVRSRRLQGGKALRLAVVPGSSKATGGVLLGRDGAGRWFVRFATGGPRSSLAIFVLDGAGKKARKLGLLPDRVQTAAVGVRADGVLVWMAHEPAKAPRGKVGIRAVRVP
jgi:hypothetical protein